ncbi:DUF6445 family protein [Burkholderia stagnalis]|uniref:DUF6445 family protein n=1 Tax=Burkholderia vietnamiensis TaxID=60552 RepID=UPI001BA40476|nr:DUF6445 family protein [Burkholderia vietnamiensis]MBR8033709.1 hypothetical protein [Burkholderia vietnamiensis]HDR9057777.1 hypothetical protein [Burkholderia vietnamiensis]
MKTRAALILDDYYESPEAIRGLALGLDFRPREGAMYPGGEAWSDAMDWESVRRDIMSELGMGMNETLIPGKNFRQGKFRLALKHHEATRPDAIHQDPQRYSAIVYLAENRHCSGGIGLYQCKLSGETSMNRRWFSALSERFDIDVKDPAFSDLVRSYCTDWSNWSQIGELPMRFNRLIILMARCFHASTGIFGTDAASGRLTQHFEIYL